jgi:hypothetical protein
LTWLLLTIFARVVDEKDDDTNTNVAVLALRSSSQTINSLNTVYTFKTRWSAASSNQSINQQLSDQHEGTITVDGYSQSIILLLL